MAIPQLQFLDKVIVAPVVHVVQVFPSRSHACCVLRQVPWLRSAVAAHLQLVFTPVVAQSLIPMASSVAVHGGRCPCSVGRASSTGAVVEETADFGVSTASCGMKLAHS